ncbi:MAG TPA: GNAT family N-acetyltransferase [Aggregatilineaceae bacterium]|nr:GNAT family N-acetyltransferase [Aggregatilineaceae bacterium]
MRRRRVGPGDRQRMIDLMVAYRAAGYVARYPTVWRFQLLLDSRVWDMERDVQLWDDEGGNLVACGLLWKRRREDPYFALERILRPDTYSALAGEVVDWAITRTAAEAVEKQAKLSLAVMPLEMNMEKDQLLLESKGFERSSEGYNVYMARPLADPVARATVPEGFRLQALEENDLELYQAIYGFTAVSSDHQRELLKNPDYQHFVIKAPIGTLAAYLECSFWRDEWAQQRVGWIDYVQTETEFQRLGLAKALMLHGFEYLRQQGANCAMLITRSDNEQGQALFKKVGMEINGNEYVYVKHV